MEVRITDVVYEGPLSNIAPQYDLEVLRILINSPRPQNLIQKSSCHTQKKRVEDAQLQEFQFVIKV